MILWFLVSNNIFIFIWIWIRFLNIFLSRIFLKLTFFKLFKLLNLAFSSIFDWIQKIGGFRWLTSLIHNVRCTAAHKTSFLECKCIIFFAIASHHFHFFFCILWRNISWIFFLLIFLTILHLIFFLEKFLKKFALFYIFNAGNACW